MIISKNVTLKKDNHEYPAELNIGKNYIYLVSSLCSISKKGDFYFHILKDIRVELQSENITILINGSRRDVYPSGMTLASYMAYVHTMGKQTSLNDLVDIFDNFIDTTKISSVEEQNEYHNQWIKSL